ncbi:PREDICTED: uncharacterized protein LOC108663466 [Theobroma cacao]|uniref:Uncharacterized protein LOC108663466 n=1 Tax=Theobroma cacao TaxID=3641 RepID=A0AB32X088_THECC|nr:PREDICTED: uncharacterized protein LOC108663466 [Theobroma cacao]
MDIDKPTTVICTVLAMDQSSFCYKACSNCETPMPDSPSHTFCNTCEGRRCPFKRLFRLLFSIATDTKVLNVVCFDRAAKVIFGCSAQQFFDFATLHPYAAKNASNALVGEMFRITLSKPKRGNAEHLRMTSVVPLRSGFQPVIETLKDLYRVIYGAEGSGGFM